MNDTAKQRAKSRAMAHQILRVATEMPRERMARRGAASLTDTELVAVLLGAGTSQRPVLDIADSVYKHLGSLDHLQITTAAELQRLPGIGEVRSGRLLAAVELGRRLFDFNSLPRIKTPENIVPLTENLVHQRREHLLAFYLDSRQHLIKRHTVSVGSVDHSQVEAREVFVPGLELPAVGVILVHNHPSGDPTPSQDDIELTQVLATAGKILGLPIIDHVIVARGGFRSLKALGYLA